MRKRIAWSMNVASVPLKKARAYAEKEFEDAGKDLDKVLPNFDKNYKMLQGKMKAALNVSRVNMPVIEPNDMAMFNKRLSNGSVDLFKPYARGKFHMPKSFGGDEGREWVTLGFEDGKKNDDMLKGSVGGVAVKKLKPTQGQIWFDKILKDIIKFGPASSGSSVLKTPVIISGDGYILDGHHRFGQAVLANPSLNMKGLVVPLGIKMLLKVGKSYGEAIGNSPKASVGSDDIALELLRVARELVNG